MNALRIVYRNNSLPLRKRMLGFASASAPTAKPLSNSLTAKLVRLQNEHPEDAVIVARLIDRLIGDD